VRRVLAGRQIELEFGNHRIELGFGVGVELYAAQIQCDIRLSDRGKDHGILLGGGLLVRQSPDRLGEHRLARRRRSLNTAVRGC